MEIKKYAPLNRAIEAVEVHMGNLDDVAAWCGGTVTMQGEGDHIIVPVLGGVKVAGYGDYVASLEGRFGVLRPQEMAARWGQVPS